MAARLVDKDRRNKEVLTSLISTSRSFRDLIKPIHLGLAAAAVWAQQPSRAVLVGVLVPSIGPSDPLIGAMRDGLPQLGYVEGQNIRIESRIGDKVRFMPKIAYLFHVELASSRR